MQPCGADCPTHRRLCAAMHMLQCMCSCVGQIALHTEGCVQPCICCNACAAVWGKLPYTQKAVCSHARAAMHMQLCICICSYAYAHAAACVHMHCVHMQPCICSHAYAIMHMQLQLCAYAVVHMQACICQHAYAAVHMQLMHMQQMCAYAAVRICSCVHLRCAVSQASCGHQVPLRKLDARSGMAHTLQKQRAGTGQLVSLRGNT
jgi:hypothetical protein